MVAAYRIRVAHLERRNVELVALCPDTPEQIREGMAKHAVKAVMLSAVSGSTNAIVHLTAIAGRAGIDVPLTWLNEQWMRPVFGLT